MVVAVVVAAAAAALFGIVRIVNPPPLSDLRPNRGRFSQSP